MPRQRRLEIGNPHQVPLYTPMPPIAHSGTVASQKEPWGSLACHVVTAHSLHTGAGMGARDKPHHSQPFAGCGDSQHHNLHSTAAPARRAKCGGMQMEASGSKRRTDHQGHTERQGETQLTKPADAALTTQGVFSRGEACAAVLLGGLTCSNKPPSSSRVNLATAGCLGSLPGKKTTRESARITLNRCRGQACSSVSTNLHPCEIQTCCDMQGKHVWGCSAPLLQAFQIKSLQHPKPPTLATDKLSLVGHLRGMS